jgi:hypothetical protein
VESSLQNSEFQTENHRVWEKKIDESRPLIVKRENVEVFFTTIVRGARFCGIEEMELIWPLKEI